MLVNFTKELYTLASGATLSARPHAAQQIKVAQGRIWLTVEGGLDDYWLQAGDVFTLPAGRLAVLQADQADSAILLQRGNVLQGVAGAETVLPPANDAQHRHAA